MRVPAQDAGPPPGGASLITMLNDPRVLYVYPDRHVWKVVEPATEIPLTVVIPVHDSARLLETLNGLRYQKYSNWSLLFVCTSPGEQALIFDALKQCREYLPKADIFTTAGDGWLSDALNAAAHSVKTDYWCRLDVGDFLHPMALQVMAQEIQATEAAYYYTCRFVVSDTLYVKPGVQAHLVDNMGKVWSGQEFPFSHLITYKTEAVARVGGFRTVDKFPDDTEWLMAYALLDAGLRLQYVNAALYYRHPRALPSNGESSIDPAGYRKSLILQHWPERYQNDYGEE